MSFIPWSIASWRSVSVSESRNHAVPVTLSRTVHMQSVGDSIRSHAGEGLTKHKVTPQGVSTIAFHEVEMDWPDATAQTPSAADALAAAFGFADAVDMQSQSECHKSRASDEYFIAAASFEGSRKGYVFKLSERGLGYYMDSPSGGRTAVAHASGATNGLQTAYSRSVLRSKRASSQQGSAPQRDFRKGFRFGGDGTERAFRAYCTTAVSNGTLTEAQVEAL